MSDPERLVGARARTSLSSPPRLRQSEPIQRRQRTASRRDAEAGAARAETPASMGKEHSEKGTWSSPGFEGA